MLRGPSDDDTAALARNARLVPQHRAVERVKGPQVVAKYSR